MGNRHYPDRHHPIFFLQDALAELGTEAEFKRDADTGDLWGLVIDGRLVVWLIDVRWPHERAKYDAALPTLGRQNALVCAAQKPDAEALGAQWLPLAATPGYGPPEQPCQKIADVAFVGYIRDASRVEIFADLAPHFSFSVAQGIFGAEAVDTYHTARVGLNVPTRYGDPLAYDANMRVFEILASGTPLVTNYLPSLDDLGINPLTHAMTYNGVEDIANCIQHLLDNPEAAQRRAQASLDLVNERHTYKHRAEQVLAWLK